MHLAPGPALSHAVLPHLPLALAIDLQPGAVNDYVQRLAATLGQLAVLRADAHLQLLLPAANLAVTGNGKPVGHLQHEHHRAGEPFRLPKAEPEQALDAQHALHAAVGVDDFPAGLLLPGVVPVFDHLVVNPQCQRATLYQRLVVGGPVRDPIFFLRLFESRLSVFAYLCHSAVGGCFLLSNSNLPLRRYFFHFRPSGGEPCNKVFEYVKTFEKKSREVDEHRTREFYQEENNRKFKSKEYLLS